MKFSEVLGRINKLSTDPSLSFLNKAKQLEDELDKCSTEEILEHLECVGVIPESFEHDSTEEKLYAKYCDALLARSLRELDLNAHMLSERSGAADVKAEADAYELVGDAKAFRLSRTAKNQKDFKVEALNQWREGADYACLVGPLYQYPSTNSQIYAQAIRYNVTLLSYTHLDFMIRSGSVDHRALAELWRVGEKIKQGEGVSQNAHSYWSTILETVLTITGKEFSDWEEIRNIGRERLRQQGEEQIGYWEQVKKDIEMLDQKTAVKKLIKAMKIDAKIAMVRRTSQLS
jgi:hypothetical protein